MYSWYPPDLLMVSPDVLMVSPNVLNTMSTSGDTMSRSGGGVLMVSPRSTHGIPRCTHGIPQCTEHPPPPGCTEHTLYRVKILEIKSMTCCLFAIQTMLIRSSSSIQFNLFHMDIDPWRKILPGSCRILYYRILHRILAGLHNRERLPGSYIGS